MNNQGIPILPDENYAFRFPLQVFSSDVVNFFGDVKKIEESLKGRNIFYSIFDKKRRKLLIDRIDSLNFLPQFVLNYLKKEMPKVTPISIFIYGSYLYGDFEYLADDIDVGIVVKKCFFKYIIDEIRTPFFLEQELTLPKKISLFIYGEDNMSKGIPIDDTIVAGLVHKETTLRELSVAYWRDIVIWGKDFNYIENNEKNILVTLARNIKGCYTRLWNFGNGKEDDNIRFKKISTRIIEVNAFLKFLFPELKIDFEYLFKLPSRAVQGDISYTEIRKLCDSTLSLYKQVIKKYQTFIKHERHSSREKNSS